MSTSFAQVVEGEKRVVEKLLSRRKLKRSYEYEVQWVGLHSDKNSWLSRDKCDPSCSSSGLRLHLFSRRETAPHQSGSGFTSASVIMHHGARLLLQPASHLLRMYAFAFDLPRVAPRRGRHAPLDLRHLLPVGWWSWALRRWSTPSTSRRQPHRACTSGP